VLVGHTGILSGAEIYVEMGMGADDCPHVGISVDREEKESPLYGSVSTVQMLFKRDNELITLYFNSPSPSDNFASVLYDKEIRFSKNSTVGALKVEIGRLLNLGVDSFTLAKGRLASYTEPLELRQLSSLVKKEFHHGELVFLKLGPAGKNKVTVLLFDLANSGKTCDFLLDIGVGDSLTVAEIAVEISKELKAALDMDFPANEMRIHAVEGDRATKILDRNEPLDILWRHRKVAIQRTKVLEIPEGQIILIIQRWFSSSWVLGEPFEIVVPKDSKYSSIGSAVADQCGIANSNNILVAKPWVYLGIDPHKMLDYDWKMMDEETSIESYPWYLKGHEILIVRDLTEDTVSVEDFKKLDQTTTATNVFEPNFWDPPKNDGFWKDCKKTSSSKESGITIRTKVDRQSST